MADRAENLAPVQSDASAPGLGAWVRQARTAQGLNQRELAERAELSRSYICDIELGRGARPSLETFGKLASALGAARTDVMRAAGYLDAARGVQADSGELRLIRLYRDLTPASRATIERFVQFVHAEEYRWSQVSFIDSEDDTLGPRVSQPEAERGPTLFDVVIEPTNGSAARG